MRQLHLPTFAELRDDPEAETVLDEDDGDTEDDTEE